MLSYPITGVREGTLQAERGRPVLERQRRMQQGLGLSHPSDRRDGRCPHRSGRPAAGADGLRLPGKALQPELPFSGQTRILTDQTPEPEPESAPAEPELLPFEPEKPFERISEFSVMNVAEQGGKPYWKVPG